MKQKALMLCSGGPDGVVAAMLLKEEGLDVTLLHFQYGQKAAPQEWKALKACAEKLGMPVVCRGLDGAFSDNSSSILQGDRRAGKDMAGPSAFLPARNLILLSIAAGMAEVGEFGYIGIGNILDGRYPDNKIGFTKQFDELLPHALSYGTVVRCFAPVVHLGKAQVILEGIRLGCPFELTWSCYESKALHCGVCASCIGRRNAFQILAVKDPVAYLV